MYRSEKTVPVTVFVAHDAVTDTVHIHYGSVEEDFESLAEAKSAYHDKLLHTRADRDEIIMHVLAELGRAEGMSAIIHKAAGKEPRK